MRHPLLAALFVSAALLLAVDAASAAPDRPKPSPTISAKAEKALAGRRRGETVSCVNLRNIHSTRVIDETAIIYEETGRRWYVNFLRGGPCRSLKPWRSLVTRTTSTRLCSIDFVRVVDPTTSVEHGTCVLGDFVEYRK